MAIGPLERRFRPLVATTIASGLVAFAMFDFAATIWYALGDPQSRGLVAAAARTSYAGFFLQAFVLIGVFHAAGRVGPRLTAVANLLGISLFFWSSVLVGRLVGTAFNIEAPSGREPPDEVAVFFAVATLLVAGFIVVLGARGVLDQLAGVLRRDGPGRAVRPVDPPPDEATPPSAAMAPDSATTASLSLPLPDRKDIP